MTESNSNGKTQHELSYAVQSSATLLKAFVFSTVIAVIVLVSAVLPVEYGIDPLGIGAAIGLSPLANSDTAAESEGSEEPLLQTGYREDSVDIKVPAGAGLEYKFHLVKDDAMRYSWSTNAGNIYFDFHGEPDGDTTGFFESYTVSTADSIRGTFTASFDGSHGWYWENKGPSPIVVSLKTQGFYEIIGLK